MSALFCNLFHFGRLLRGLGLDVQAGRMLDAARALEHIDLGRRRDFYYALRALLVHRPQDLPVFDAAFLAFWRVPGGERRAGAFRAFGERRRHGPLQTELPTARDSSDEELDRPEAIERVERVVPLTYSSRSVARHKDFAAFTEAELAQARALLAELRWDPGVRESRRWQAGRGVTPDLRRALRRNLRYGTELVLIPRRQRRQRQRPLVLICDVSGSMERYTRMFLHFIHSVAGGLERVEAFLFATRLTRVTRQLMPPGTARLQSRPTTPGGARLQSRPTAQTRVDEAVASIPRQVPDWAGGTRIGEALRAFNVEWGRRVLVSGPVVLLISDGWDRGDPQLLAAEMARLQRSCRRLIWLNPLLGSPEYAPLTRGMQAALPFIDDFLPVHNLASLESLAAHLNQLPARRPPRGSRGLVRRVRLEPDRDQSHAAFRHLHV